MNKYFRKALSIVLASAMMVSSAPGLTLAEETPKTEAAAEAETGKGTGAAKEEAKQTEAKKTEEKTAQAETKPAAEAPKETQKETPAAETPKTEAPKETPAEAKSEEAAKEEAAAPKTEETAAPKAEESASAKNEETASQTDAAQNETAAAKPAKAPRKAPDETPSDDGEGTTYVAIKWTVDGEDAGTSKSVEWTKEKDWTQSVKAELKVANEDLTVAVEKPEKASDPGEYTFTATVEASDPDTAIAVKAKESTATFTLTINKKKITGIKWYGADGKDMSDDTDDTDTVTYDGKPHSLTAKGVVDGDPTVDLPVKDADGNTKEANASDTEYVFTVQDLPADGLGKYYEFGASVTEDAKKKSLKIDQAVITGINWLYDGKTFPTEDPVFDNKDHTVTAQGMVKDQGPVDLTVKDGTVKDAKEYTFTAELSDSTNYKFADGVEAQTTKTLTVEKATITSIDWKYDGGEFPTENPTYDGKEHQVAATAHTDAAGDLELALDKAAAKDAGEYTFKATIPENYKLGDGVTATKDLTIQKATINNITLATDSYVYTGEMQKVPYVTAADGVVEADKENIASLFTAEAPDNFTDAKEYSVEYKLSEAGDKNYTLAEGAGKKTVTIKPATITAITLAKDSFTYNGKDQSGDIKIREATGVVKSDEKNLETLFTRTLTKKDGDKDVSVDKFTDAGSYTASYTLSDKASNYQFAETVTKIDKELTIARKETTLTWTWKASDNSGDKTGTSASSVYKKDRSYNLSVTYKDADGKDAEIDERLVTGDKEASTVKEGGYKASVTTDAFNKQYPNYELKADDSSTMTIAQDEITSVAWTFGGKDQTDPVSVFWTRDDFYTGKFTATATSKQGDTVDLQLALTGDTATEGKAIEPGEYTVTASLKDEDKVNYSIDDQKITNLTLGLTIKKRTASVTWEDSSLTQVYAAKALRPSVSMKDQTNDVNAEDEKDLSDPTPTVAEAVNVGTYPVKITYDAAHYDLAEGSETEKQFTINPATIKDTDILWGATSLTYNAAEQRPQATFKGIGKDSGNTYTVAPSTLVIEGVDGAATAAVHVGSYKATANDNTAYTLNGAAVMYKNYTLDGSKDYSINKRKVTITPKAGQKRFYGQADDQKYTNKKSYHFTWAEGEDEETLTDTFISEIESIEIESISLGGDVVRYTDAADTPVNLVAPGTYDFKLNLKEDKTLYGDYEITLTHSQYEVKKVSVSPARKEITSRAGSLSVLMDSLNDLKKGQKTDDEAVSGMKLVLEAELPKDNKGISYDQNISSFLDGEVAEGEGNTQKVVMSGLSHKTDKNLGDKVSVKTVTYSAEGQSWGGKLPAGTEITVYYVDAQGNEVSKKTKVDVVKQKVGLVWGSTADADPAPNYLSKNDQLTVSAADEDSKGEVIKVTYAGLKGGKKYYDTLNQTIKPVAKDSATAHLEQTAKATFVDVLNLEFTPDVAYTFKYDAKAFAVTQIEFSNRDKEIHIVLPETGTVTAVNIAGAKVTTTGEAGKEFTFKVKWSGKSLIRTGTAIEVTYKDQAGNEGKGSSSAKRSSVRTPISLKIRPSLNRNGYLNGTEAATLIVSGTACGDEPIRITVAGSSKQTYVTGKETWTDSTGTWEVSFNMAELPEGGDFEITAEYVDVDGKPASMTAKYNAYVCKPNEMSPLFEMMPFISGMVEPNTAVIVEVGGNSYEVNVDKYGHFVCDDYADLIASGESFTIKVIDVAGNENTLTSTIPEVDEDGRIGAEVQPLGKLFYDGGKDSSAVYGATPVAMSDLEKGDEELQLLYGYSYKIGSMTLSKSKKGFTISKNLDEEIFFDPDSYEEEDESLFVYDHEPTVEELRNHAGTEYKAGDEIKAGDDDIVWIQYEENLKMSPDDLNSDILYNFEYLDEDERKEEPEKYEEYEKYVYYQTFDPSVLSETGTEAVEAD